MTKNHRVLSFGYGHQIAENGRFKTVNGKTIHVKPEQMEGFVTAKAIKLKDKDTK